jgi:TolB-like protein/Flp pilus assembly protein TadD
MKTATNICGKCGAKIPDDATREVCPACLLETGLGLLPDPPVAASDDSGPVGSTEIPSKFGDFEIARREDGSLWELGHGGMGVTYRARDSVLHRSVALKVIEVPPGAGQLEVARERFLREARAAAALRHPNVAAVYHFGTRPAPDRCYYAMELVEGETLEARVRREGPLKVTQVLEIGAQVTRALIAAANQGLIHRDLKPGNIMLTRIEDSSAGFEVKVIDFGLAKITAESFGEMDLTHGGFVGTPSYASPEQFTGGRVDARSDIYSLGASLWFALTGHLPCAGSNVEEIRRCQREAPLPVQQLVARKVPAPVIALLRSMLAVDPEGRPASARELTEGIEECRLKVTGGDETTRRSFFAELQRRNVYKVAIAYAVVAWLLMQIATQVFPFLEIPNWAIRLVIVLLVLGFPIALIIAWAFELTPEGLKRTEVADREPAKPSRKAAWIYVVTVAAALSVGLFFVGRYTAPKRAMRSGLLEKSIAVLPFENLSEDKANAYFADGIQGEILTRLAKIADLKVISRTSTQRYQSKPGNLAEIAKQLGVANILEGSVQKAADQVRVNVQLINAQTDSHLWAETYDRKLTDIFGVESEIAKGIAESLQAKLTGREEQALAVKPTNNPEAYDAYLRGMAFEARSIFAGDALLKAIDFYERAVQLDPKFALAWARLSRADAILYFWRSDTTPGRRDAAKRALENAQRLELNSPETQLALGYYQYLVLRDYGLAKTMFSRVSQMLPGSSEVPWALGRVTRREGNWDENIAYFEQALTLDPRNVELLVDAALTYTHLRQFPVALKLYDRALDIVPNDPGLMVAKAFIYQAQGNLQEAAKLLTEADAQSPSPRIFRAKITQLRLERNLGEAVRLLQARQTQFHFTSEIDKAVDQLFLAGTQRLAGDTASAKATAEQARNTLGQLYKDQPDNADLAAPLAVAYAWLNQKDSALKEAERAITLFPSAKDAVEGPDLEENMALVEMIIGENSRAVSTLTRLLQMPYLGWLYGTPITRALLRLDPLWDPLRSDPAFQKLCEENQAVAPELVTQSAAEKSIAVLPFENLSEDKANAYFAEGIQDEILTRLSKIADLRVISRTSTQHYKSAPENLPEIARQLGVAHILEGSVQKSGDAVRVNVQLIKAADDSHLWADSFDRKLTDIFSVESEVAKAIADQLQAKLTGQEEQVIAAKPTENTEAYDAYLRGLAYSLKTATTPANILAAQKYLREAVRLDPKFALSWALLSYVDALGYVTAALQRTITLREEARQAAETALTLQPNLGEAVLAKGYYHHACLKDYDTAVRYFEQARQLLPNSSRIPESLAYVARRRGQWDRSESFFNEAERLDPRNVSILTAHATNYICLRRFPEALRKLDQVLNIIPDDVDTLVENAGIAQAEGDLPRASAILAPLHPNADDAQAVETQVYQAILERRPAQIIPRLKEILAKPDPSLGFYNGELRFWLGWAQEVAGDHAAAQKSWRQARSELESFLKEQTENYQLIGDLALINMGLGDKAAAFKLIERAMAAIPIEKDAIDGTGSIDILARVAAQVGEPDRAIAALQKLLSIPYGGALVAPLTPALLRLDPMFDPLRNDPRFQKLCEEKQP